MLIYKSPSHYFLVCPFSLDSLFVALCNTKTWLELRLDPWMMHLSIHSVPSWDQCASTNVSLIPSHPIWSLRYKTFKLFWKLGMKHFHFANDFLTFMQFLSKCNLASRSFSFFYIFCFIANQHHIYIMESVPIPCQNIIVLSDRDSVFERHGMGTRNWCREMAGVKERGRSLLVSCSFRC